MPKIVDHDAHREELARRSVPIFRKLGYHGLSMRRIASELGISKSSLYHSFEGKRELFEAASTHATTLTDLRLPTEATAEQRYKALVGLALEIEQSFAGELTLLLDYLRGKSPQEVRDDRRLAEVVDTYRRAVGGINRPESSQYTEALLSQLFGLLLLRLFDGRRTGFDTLQITLRAVVG